jgi:hypothetical protein
MGSQTEGVGDRVENADLENAASGLNATNRSKLYST